MNIVRDVFGGVVVVVVVVVELFSSGLVVFDIRRRLATVESLLLIECIHTFEVQSAFLLLLNRQVLQLA